jgi:D-alanine transaminase
MALAGSANMKEPLEAGLVLMNFSFVASSLASVSIHERALEFGDSLYEVLKVRSGMPLFLEGHLERLKNGMRFLAFPGLPIERLKASLLELVLKNALTDGLLYLQVSRGCNPREHVPPQNLTPTFWAYTMKADFDGPKERRGGVRVISKPDSRWMFPSIKTTNLLPNTLAKAEAKGLGADEALFVGPNGEIREASSANVFFVKKKAVFTPKLTPQILPGITRMALLKLLGAHGIEAHEADLTLQEALGMDESFLTATSYDIRPIEALDGNLYASCGPDAFTAAIMELFEAHIQEVVGKGSLGHAREVQ